jgi:RNA polymerase sigma factor (sigma-70 family)
MRTVTAPAERQARPHLPRRLLALAGDDRLVEQIRRGNEAAFEVAFERHSAAILSFCRHMLGSRDEAEDAVQHTFAAAYRKLVEDDREIRLKPWLYAIARNRSLSMLRARREEAAEDVELETAGLQEQVQQRADLRELLRDLGDLPSQQREALLLAELGDLAHADIADVLGCEVERVKALVFRARSGLIERRDARDMPCAEVQAQLANLRGGSLRRTEIKHHLRVCEGCREFRADVRRQRQLLALALPAVPSAGLKAAVLGAIGLGGGSAGGGAALIGGSSIAAKLAVAGVLVGGGAVVGTTALEGGDAAPNPSSPPAAAADQGPGAPGSTPLAAADDRTERRASRRRAARRRAAAQKRRRARRRRMASRRTASSPVAQPGGRGRQHAPGQVGKTKKPKKAKRIKKVKPTPPRAKAKVRPPKAKGPPPVAPPPPPPPPPAPRQVEDDDDGSGDGRGKGPKKHKKQDD